MQENEIEILKLSVSAVKTYEQCPLKYYYNYVEKQPKKEWDHLKLGSMCHEALEFFHKALMIDPYRNKTDLMKESFIHARTKWNLNHFNLAEAKSILADYLKFALVDEHNVVSVEEPFVFNIAENILVRGFIDRVDFEKDGYHILDYKTSKDRKWLEPFQLTVYGLWLQEKYGIDNYKASYIMLREKSSYLSYEINKKDIVECKKQLLKYAEKIAESKLTENWVPVSSFLCNYCDHKDICPEFKQGW